MRNFVKHTIIAGGALAAILTTGAAAHADVVHPAIAPVVAPAIAPNLAPNVAPNWREQLSNPVDWVTHTA